jgi:hypothetical protein
MKGLDSFKSLSPLEIALLVVFVLFIIFPIKLPMMVATMIESPLGFLSLFVITIYLFSYVNPVLGIIYIFVAYEFLRRSSEVTGNMAMIQHSPSQANKDRELEIMNPPRDVTLEEEVIRVMAPAQSQFIKSESGSNFKPIMESVVGASLF